MADGFPAIRGHISRISGMLPFRIRNSLRGQIFPMCCSLRKLSCAANRARTGTRSPSRDFKSLMSANSIIAAWARLKNKQGKICRSSGSLFLRDEFILIYR